MIDTTLMGPGFFMFFQRNIIESAGHEGVDYGEHHPYKYRKRVRFKFADEEEKKAAPIIERIAEQIIETPEIETDKDIELILILRLEMQGLIYKSIYLEWIIEQQKRYNIAIALLLLH